MTPSLTRGWPCPRRHVEQQQQTAASFHAHPAVNPVHVFPAPSNSATRSSVSVSLPTPPPPPPAPPTPDCAAVALPEQPPSEPSEPSTYTSSYASPAVGTSKSFCDLIADGANLLLDGLGTIDMDDVELPSAFFAAHQPGSSHPSPTHAEVIEALSRSRVYTRAPSLGIPVDSVDPANSVTQGENGNSADAETSTEKRRRDKGWVTPLHMAARKGQDKIVRTLLQHNADCNLRDGDGLTPLLRAVVAGHCEIVSLLLSHGACIDLVDQQSRSALHWATVQKQEAVLRVLLEHGGGGSPLVNNYDDDGMTSLHIAVDHGFDAGVQLLLQFGASVHG